MVPDPSAGRHAGLPAGMSACGLRRYAPAGSVGRSPLRAKQTTARPSGAHIVRPPGRHRSEPRHCRGCTDPVPSRRGGLPRASARWPAQAVPSGIPGVWGGNWHDLCLPKEQRLAVGRAELRGLWEVRAMVTIYDMRTGNWTDDEVDLEGPGRGGCCRPAPSRREARPAMPRLELALLPVASEVLRPARRR
jgi:hypothetical protein